MLLLGLGTAMITGCGKDPVPQWEGIATTTTAPLTTANPQATVEIVDRGDETFTSSTEGTTLPDQTTAPTAATEPSYDEDGYMTYESYIALSGEKQMEYFYTFPDGAAFNEWYNAAKKAYEEAHPKETIGPDGNINLGD